MAPQSLATASNSIDPQSNTMDTETSNTNTNHASNDLNGIINDLIYKAENGVFLKVKFLKSNKEKLYTSIYNWFQSQRVLNNEKLELEFKCILCSYTKTENIGKPGNLLKHLVTLEVGKKWFDLFDAHKNKNKKNIFTSLDKNTLLLAKFFINSNIALKALESKSLRQLLPVKMTKYNFKKVVLPSLMNILKTIINDKLRSCEYVNLITDIWTNFSTVDYLALGANLINQTFKRDTLMIGMIEMDGRHTAENIKIAIEKIINQ